VAAAGGGAATSPATDTTITPGTLVVATELGYPPYRVYKNGKYSGIELELVQKIASNLGFKKVKFVNTKFDLMIPGIAAKKWDVIADLMFGWAPPGTETYKRVTDRTKLVSFSRPYFRSTYVLATSKKNNPSLKSASQLQDGQKVAAQKGGADFVWAERELGSKGVQIVEKNSFATSLPALESGLIDAIIEDLAIVTTAQKTRKDLQFGPPIAPLSSAYCAMAFDPENVALRQAFNRELGKLIANGYYKGLFAKYLPGYPFPKFPTTSFVHK
jgi:polar amino acid transport system substrate-binding protein